METSHSRENARTVSLSGPDAALTPGARATRQGRSPLQSASVLVAAAAMLGASALTGCRSTDSPSGGYPGSSHSWESEMAWPKTLVLVDSRTNEPIWVYEIPAGMRLVTRFTEGDAPIADEMRPDFLLYDVFNARQPAGNLANRLPVPPPDGRRWEVFLRPMPELPPLPATGLEESM